MEQMNEITSVAEKGVRFAREGRYQDALKTFDEDLCFTESPTAMSYYAICLAKVEGNFERAISLCLMAAEKEFYNPDIYLNFGKIFLMNGQKSVAIKAFKKGLKFDSTHDGILVELDRLGMRRRPVVPFLPRQNVVNKLLGMLAQSIV